ncbi:hypothetical protein [Salipaludibacillus keqinensis]|uniref:hypothetical protein n=1 Tax=Salipaludibacillus keqinensis TaxID=2045207 RepID=UPI001304B493|nr:hypothetical protein [Salipaludibacillus keqinensis]
MDLRKQLDERTSNGSPKPFNHDLHHDLYEEYHGCRDYLLYREVIEYYLAFVKE